MSEAEKTNKSTKYVSDPYAEAKKVAEEHKLFDPALQRKTIEESLRAVKKERIIEKISNQINSEQSKMPDKALKGAGRDSVNPKKKPQKVKKPL